MTSGANQYGNEGAKNSLRNSRKGLWRRLDATRYINRFGNWLRGTELAAIIKADSVQSSTQRELKLQQTTQTKETRQTRILTITASNGGPIKMGYDTAYLRRISEGQERAIYQRALHGILEDWISKQASEGNQNT